MVIFKALTNVGISSKPIILILRSISFSCNCLGRVLIRPRILRYVYDKPVGAALRKQYGIIVHNVVDIRYDTLLVESFMIGGIALQGLSLTLMIQ
jgi:hypothetical protein